MALKILVADDEEKIRKLVRKYAEREGYEVIEAENGKEAYELAIKEDVDLCILDVMMPIMDGFEAYQKIRTEKDIPCIFLTALNEEYNRIYGFDVGADDYVAKPFSTNELMKRVGVIFKRMNKETITNNSITKIEGLVIDEDARTVTIDGTQETLSLKEYELLLYLVKNRGTAVTRETLLEKIWGYGYFKDDRTLDTHIKLLRKTLGPYAKYITTIRGVGYRFEKNA